MLRMARAILRSPADAQDAVQDAFVELARHRLRLANAIDLDAYAFATLRHVIFRRQKQQRSEQERIRSLRPAETEESAPSMRDDLDAALMRLPREQREVIALKVDADLTLAQIAEILSISPNTAASRYRYAMEKLRKILE